MQSQPMPYPPQEQVENIAYLQPNKEIQSLIEHLDPRRSLEELEHFLKGEKKDFNQSTDTKTAWIKDKRFQKMNDIGVNQVMGVLTSIVNSNTILSSLDEKRISLIMRTLTKDIVLLLKINYRDYEIDKRELFSITMIILRTVYLTLRRAMFESEKDLLKGLFKSVESMQSVMTQQPQAKSKFDSFKFWQ